MTISAKHDAVHEPQPIDKLRQRFESVRQFSDRIAEPLSAEDCAIQSMPDVSPTRWHLAHTTWFFETFLLKNAPGYRVYDPSFEFLFNSYYNTIGKQFPRASRGLLSRPGLQNVLQYRQHVDRAIVQWMHQHIDDREKLDVLTIGLNHEQQHQELMLTDIKHVLSCNPLDPVYRDGAAANECTCPQTWITVDEDLCWIGHDSDRFAFDNERPYHRVFVDEYQLSNRCVTNAEFLEFISDGGYQRPELWLSLGWDAVKTHRWQAPLYWSLDDNDWTQFTLSGRQPLNPHEPVCHVSYFEADAYARWAGCRLPTEQEWEHAIGQDLQAGWNVTSGHWSDLLFDNGRMIHPQVERDDDRTNPFVDPMGNVWQWTASPYTAYPGYQAPSGALGEYNGKFMCNQFVLRGGSCASPSNHVRATYRNFFPPDARWQFAGIRLAR